MARNDEYKDNLNKIVFHSADVLPKRVITYLQGVAEHNHSDVIKEVFKNYQPLADRIPKEFIDFAVDVLISKPRCPITPRDNLEYAIYLAKSNRFKPRSMFGIRDNWDYELFNPPAYIHGPFLYLLSKDENEGLRLVHTLTNAATDRWYEYTRRESLDEQESLDERFLTVLPIKLNLPFGEQEFWGDVQVYCLYRGGMSYNGSNTVMSALMALEVWMEKQIENGRDIEELFEKVLRGSNSVAVLGICISLTLAHPQKCLKAALPIVSSPAIWSIDIQRLVDDMSSRFRLPFERNDWVYKLLEEHDQKPHRKLDIRSLATHYLFFSDESLRISFEQAVSQFTENLPFQYREEEQDSVTISAIHKKMENYQAFGKRENYQLFKNGDNLYVQFQQPEHIKKRNEKELAINSEYQRWLRMELWSRKAIEENNIEDREALEEMVKWAKEFQQSNDFTSEESENSYDNSRLGAIASVAAAALVIDFEWMKAQDLLQWSKDILMLAARAAQPSVYARPLCRFDVSAGRGLAALAAHGIADLEARRQILLLVGKSLKRFAHSDDRVLKVLFLSLQSAWSVDPVLFWNALSLCLSLSIIPGQVYYGTRVGEFGTSYEELETWEDNIIQSHFDYLAKNEIPQLPRIPTARNTVFVHEQAKYGLYALPLTELCQVYNIKDNLLQLCDNLIARTIEDNLPVEGRQYSQPNRPYTWNPFIFNWTAYLAKSLSIEEIRHHILTPLQNSWAKVPDLTADLLDGYISHQIAYVEGPTEQALEIWKEICTWVLDNPEISRKASHDYLDRDTEKVLQLLVFTQHGSSRIKDDWQYAHLFVDIFDRWVGVAGHNPDTYSHLIIMLNGIGWQFSPEPTLNWLSQCASNATHDLWSEKRGNGRRTAELLNRIWINFETQIRKNTESLKRYSELVYRLVRAGVPLASTLQRKLEGRG
ncbi:hypothetical protein ACKFKF_09565 [Phormidesmis sp. 146-12]